ncbi:MAG: hypothetical protein KA371_00985 [Acidobacteria bacterium]|nr:hypothetical protein [Acidobacteriota bacterium]
MTTAISAPLLDTRSIAQLSNTCAPRRFARSGWALLPRAAITSPLSCW